MRSLSTFAILLLGLAVVAMPVAAYAASLQSQIDALQAQIDAIELIPGPPGSPARFEFFGYSINNTVFGDAGYVGLTQACAAEFPSSVVRACTTEELIKSPGIVSPADDAWIVPVFVGTSAAPGGSSDISAFTVTDYSGLSRREARLDSGASFLACNQWTSA